MKILEMSIAGTACILIVLVLRVLLRKMPKVFSYILWALVFLRLICPFSLRSSHFGLMLGDMGQRLETAAYEQELVEYQVLVHKDGRVETLARYDSLEPAVSVAEDREEVWDHVVNKSSHQGSTGNVQSNMIGSRYSHSAVQRQVWQRCWDMAWCLIYCCEGGLVRR